MSLRKFPMLVVDQNPLTRWVLSTRLSEVGHTVREAATAVKTRGFLQSEAHLVLLDPDLPDADELEFLVEIRRRFPESPVIVMAVFSSPETRRTAEQMLGRFVLDKPVDVEYLLELVDQCQS